MRNAFAAHLTRLAADRPELFLVSGDIGNRLFDEYKASFPDRFLNAGVAEQNMIGLAAGLAASGFHPVVYTIASFATARCYEQIKLDVCYHNQPVTIVGTGAGLSYAALGPSHFALEDIAIMRVLPRMTVLTPCDAMETEACLALAVEIEGPSYLRLGKKGEPQVHATRPALNVGRWLPLSEGRDITILAAGTAVSLAIAVSESLSTTGIAAGVISCPTVKPVDAELLRELAIRPGLLVTMEEHSAVGGFGSAVLEHLSTTDAPFGSLLILGTDDEFPDLIGDQAFSRDELGLSVESMTNRIRGRLAQSQ